MRWRLHTRSRPAPATSRRDSMMADAETELLARLARDVEHGCIVEVGSYRGASTITLAREARVPVYAIDPHESFTGVMGHVFGPEDRVEFFQNLLDAAVVEKVRLVSLSSEVVAPQWTLPVGLLFVDGDHRYDAVRRDFTCWEPHLRGPVAFHDSTEEGLGPTQLVAELADAGWRVVERVDATTVLGRD